MRKAWNIISNLRDKKSGKFIRGYYLQSYGMKFLFEDLELDFTKSYFGFKVRTKRYKTEHYYKYYGRAIDGDDFLELHICKKEDRELALLTCKIGDSWGLERLYRATLDRIDEGGFILWARSDGISLLTPETILGEILAYKRIDLVPLDVFLTGFSRELNWLLKTEKGGHYVSERH